jgi:hypothetical protein
VFNVQLDLLAAALLDGLLASHCYELRVTQVVVECPFEEFKAPYKQGPEPDAVLHLLRGETLTPAAALGFGQIHKRTFGGFQILKLPEQPLRGKTA